MILLFSYTSDFFYYTIVYTYRRLVVHLFLSILIKGPTIKFNQIQMSSCWFPLPFVQMVTEGFKLPAIHQLVKRYAIHWRLRTFVVPVGVVLDSNYCIVQIFCKVPLHSAVFVLPPGPVFPLLVEQGKYQVDHDLQVARRSEPLNNYKTIIIII